MPTSLMYPQAAPVVAGPHTVTLDTLLKTPTYILQQLVDISRKNFVADYLFRSTVAVPSGSVIYRQRITDAAYSTRDVAEMAPGDEFPMVTMGESAELTAITRTWGGAFQITDQAIRRNAFDQVNNGLIRLRNTMARKSEAVSIAALSTSPLPIPTITLTTAWDDLASDPLGVLPDIIGSIDDADEGYRCDIFLTNPYTLRKLQARKDIRDALPKESKVDSPLFDRRLQDLMDLTWIGINGIPKGEGWLLASQQVGVLGEEEALTVETVPLRTRRVTQVQAWRSFVPVVTDPLAARHILNLAT